MAEAAQTSTIPPPVAISRLKRARLLRRIFIVLLASVLLVALSGRLGVRTAETTGSAKGYSVTVTYASVTRPGLATPWSVEVRRAGGFVDPVTVAVSGDYLDLFDENGLDPDPAISRADAEFVYWTFEVPPGDTLSVSFDARIEPAAQWGREGKVKLIRESEEIVEVPFRTWVMP